MSGSSLLNHFDSQTLDPTARLVDGEDITFENQVSGLMYASSSISQKFDSLATAMTQEMRRNDYGTPVVTGRAIAQVTRISVRWEWLMLPLLTMLSGAAFLALTVIATARARVPLWKEDALATLMHGLAPSSTADEMARSESNKAMGELAKEASVRLCTGEDAGMNLVADTEYTMLKTPVREIVGSVGGWRS